MKTPAHTAQHSGHYEYEYRWSATLGPLFFRASISAAARAVKEGSLTRTVYCKRVLATRVHQGLHELSFSETLHREPLTYLRVSLGLPSDGSHSSPSLTPFSLASPRLPSTFYLCAASIRSLGCPFATDSSGTPFVSPCLSLEATVAFARRYCHRRPHSFGAWIAVGTTCRLVAAQVFLFPI